MPVGGGTHQVVYMAESVALAVLENLVHMSRQDFPNGYVCVAAVLPDSVSITTEQDLRLQARIWLPPISGIGANPIPFAATAKLTGADRTRGLCPDLDILQIAIDRNIRNISNSLNVCGVVSYGAPPPRARR